MKRNTTVVATLAAAAVSGVAVGVLLNGLGHNGTPTSGATPPPTTTSAPVTSTSRPPTTVPTSAVSTTPATPPVTPPTTSATTSQQQTAVSENSLLVANDYLAAGLVNARMSIVGEGAGQSTISRCQRDNPSAAEGLVRMFTGAVEGEELSGSQYAMQFSSQSTAVEMANTVTAWRTCELDPTISEGITLEIGPVHQVTLTGAAEGQWWDIVYAGVDNDMVDRVSVVRTGTHVSVTVVTGPKATIAPFDMTKLSVAAATRLG